MPALHRSAPLVFGAALALCACNRTNASPQDASPSPRAPEAPLACAGPSDPTCGPDAYCKADSESKAGGRCAPRPQMCPMIYRPVCGADGRTYPNTCHAERAGVNLAHDGACAK